MPLLTASVNFSRIAVLPSGLKLRRMCYLPELELRTYIGRALSRLLSLKWRTNVAAIPSTELLTNLDDHILAEKQYLLVSFSRSGESSEGIALLQLALDRYPKQIRHLLITCNESGSMAKFPGIFTITLDDIVNDRGLAMTSSFSNMVLTGQYLASIHDTTEYSAAVRKMAAIGDALLPAAADMAAELAHKAFQRVCLLGTGALQAMAQESSLKVLELNGGKLPTLAESFLGLRHGPMSFLNKETLVVAFLSNDEDRLPYELDLLEEIREKKLAGEILVRGSPPHRPRSKADKISAHAGYAKTFPRCVSACSRYHRRPAAGALFCHREWHHAGYAQRRRHQPRRLARKNLFSCRKDGIMTEVKKARKTPLRASVALFVFASLSFATALAQDAGKAVVSVHGSSYKLSDHAIDAGWKIEDGKLADLTVSEKLHNTTVQFSDPFAILLEKTAPSTTQPICA